MLLFSRLQVVENRTIFIPDHIRAALGLLKGTELHVSTVKALPSSLKNEIILSPIPLHARGEIWRLRATFKDRRGILAELLQLLREENIDVVYSRTTVLEQGQILSVELQLNADAHVTHADSGSSQWENAAGPTLPDLHGRILATFIEDLDFPFLAKPILSIRRNIPLYRSKIHQDERERAVIVDNRITISKSLEAYVRDSYKRVYPSISSLTGPNRFPLASIIGDSENAVIRIMFVYRNTGHIHVRVRANNRTGWLHRITTELRVRNFNILRMYTRMLRNMEESITDFLLHLPPEYDTEQNDKRLRRYVSGIFQLSSLKGLDCQLQFPLLLGKQARKRKVI